MANYFFGANLIENLTTGMYTNSLVIFREYIQNSCDAIDKARDEKILAADDEQIEITIDHAARRITIEDNGTGISVLDFKSVLTSIAASDKSFDTDRGFRGIGRLCGVAYCRELRFTSTAHGEGVQSTMTIDAEKLRGQLYGKEKLKAEDLLDVTITFNTNPAEHLTRRKNYERKFFAEEKCRPFITQSRLCNSRRNASRFFFALERRHVEARREARD